MLHNARIKTRIHQRSTQTQTRPHRGTVSNLIRACVRVHRTVVAVGVGSQHRSQSSVLGIWWRIGRGLHGSQFGSGLTIRNCSALSTLVLSVCWWYRETSGPLTRVIVKCGSHLEVKVTLASDLIISESPGKIWRSLDFLANLSLLCLRLFSVMTRAIFKTRANSLGLLLKVWSLEMHIAFCRGIRMCIPFNTLSQREGTLITAFWISSLIDLPNPSIKPFDCGCTGVVVGCSIIWMGYGTIGMSPIAWLWICRLFVRQTAH